MNYSKGISWIDDCRIPFTDEGDMKNTLESKYTIGKDKQSDMGFGTKKIGNVSKAQGRFPANLLCSDDVLNDGSVSKSSGNVINNTKPQTIYGNGKGIPRMKHENIPSDQGTNSRYYDIDKWFNQLLNKQI